LCPGPVPSLLLLLLVVVAARPLLMQGLRPLLPPDQLPEALIPEDERKGKQKKIKKR